MCPTAITSSQHLRGARSWHKHTTVWEDTWPIRNRPLAAMFITAQRDCLALYVGVSRGGPRDATRGPRPTAHRSVSATSATDSGTLPRTRCVDYRTCRVFVSVAALYSMSVLLNRHVEGDLGCSGGRSDDRAMSDGCRGRSGYVRMCVVLMLLSAGLLMSIWRKGRRCWRDGRDNTIQV